MRINIVCEDKIFSRMIMNELKRRSFDASVSSSESGATVVIVDRDTVNSEFSVPTITFSYNGNTDLVRPFAIKDLVYLLKNSIKNTSNAQHTSRFTTVCDPDSNTVRVNDAVIQMTKQEYLLFELLYKNAGKTVSKDEIFDCVWNGAGNDNKLRVYIKYIREKTEPIYKKKIIFSVRDRGYSMKFD